MKHKSDTKTFLLIPTSEFPVSTDSDKETISPSPSPPKKNIKIPMVFTSKNKCYLEQPSSYFDLLAAISKYFKANCSVTPDQYSKFLNTNLKSPLFEQMSSIHIDTMGGIKSNLMSENNTSGQANTSRDFGDFNFFLETNIIATQSLSYDISVTPKLDLGSYYFITKDSNGWMKKFDTKTQTFTENFNQLSNCEKIIGVRTSSDRKSIFFFNDKSELIKWDVADKKIVLKLQFNLANLLGYEISPDASFAISFGKDYRLTKFTFLTKEFEVLSKSSLIPDNSIDIKMMRISPDNNFVWFGYKNCELVLYSILSKEISKRFGEIHDSITVMRLSKDGEILYTAGMAEIKLFSLKRQIMYKKFGNVSSSTIHAIELSSDGKRLYVGDFCGNLKVICSETGGVFMDFGKISEKQIWRLFLTDDDRF
jgi:hypothetical protein